jgi:cytochrome c oxidase assembly protein subunit 15
MNPHPHSSLLHRFALITALATLGLIGIGGLVTSHGVGMAVPDWPTSYGYNMFALPFSIWFTGGVFHEHTHRQWASIVGVLVVILTRWLGGADSRRPILLVGAIELAAGLILFQLGDQWRGAGGFLSGIGGVVLLVGIIPNRNAPAAKPLPALGWWAFWLVQFQGLLGGLRVVLDPHSVGSLKLGLVFGIFHACLAQAFFVLLCVIAWMTSRHWIQALPTRWTKLNRGMVLATGLIFLQLLLGATMRHQHAGLAIPDFPLAYGEWWPPTDPDSILRYNQQRVEIAAVQPITAFHIQLQMIHRVGAILILFAVGYCAWTTFRRKESSPFLRRATLAWFVLILVQAGLGAATVLTHKAADIATFHVVAGVLSLATGAMLCILTARSPWSAPRTALSSDSPARARKTASLTADAAQS